MKANDEAAQEHIDFLDDHCSNLEDELTAEKYKLSVALARIRQLESEQEISL